MSSPRRSRLCSCCTRDTAAVSHDKFPLARNANCVSMGIQTDSFLRDSFDDDYYDNPCCDATRYHGTQNDDMLGYQDEVTRDGDGYSYLDQDEMARINMQHWASDGLSGHCGRFPCSPRGNVDDGENSEEDELAHTMGSQAPQRGQPIDSQNSQQGQPAGSEASQQGEPMGSHRGHQACSKPSQQEQPSQTLQRKQSDGSQTSKLGHKKGHHRHLREKTPEGSLARSAQIAMACDNPSFDIREKFTPASRPYASTPYCDIPSFDNREACAFILRPTATSFRSLSVVDPFYSERYETTNDDSQLDHPESNRRRATVPDRRYLRPRMQRVGRSRISSAPLRIPKVDTFTVTQDSNNDNPFTNPQYDYPREIWQHNENVPAYLFGWGKNKKVPNKADAKNNNKMKMLYQISNAGVTCNCGQRLQFNLSVEENEGRCVACFEQLRQEFTDLLDVYKEMGYSPCECKGIISATDLANEYLMDQANNVTGRGYDNVGDPRRKTPVKTIELTPTEGFTGCMCREIKMKLFKKPRDLVSCKCGNEGGRPRIVLRPAPNESRSESSLDSETDPECECESPCESQCEPESKTQRLPKNQNKEPAEVVVNMMAEKGSSESSSRRSAISKQSVISNSTSFETAPSDSSVQSNKTYILPEHAE